MALYDNLKAEAELLERYTDPETGEVSDEFFEAKEIEEGMTSDKVDNTGKFIANLNGENESIDLEIQRLTAKKNRNIKIIEALKKYIDYVMTKFGYEKLTGNLFNFGYRKSEQTEILQQGLLPRELRYKRVTLQELTDEHISLLQGVGFEINPEETVNKTEIKKWFKNLSLQEQEEYKDIVVIKEIKNLQIK